MLEEKAVKDYKEKIFQDMKYDGSDLRTYFDEEQTDEVLVKDELDCSEDDILPYNIDCQRMLR